MTNTISLTRGTSDRGRFLQRKHELALDFVAHVIDGSTSPIYEKLRAG